MIDNMEVMTNNYCRLFYRLTSVWSLMAVTCLRLSWALSAWDDKHAKLN